MSHVQPTTQLENVLFSGRNMDNATWLIYIHFKALVIYNFLFWAHLHFPNSILDFSVNHGVSGRILMQHVYLQATKCFHNHMPDFVTFLMAHTVWNLPFFVKICSLDAKLLLERYLIRYLHKSFQESAIALDLLHRCCIILNNRMCFMFTLNNETVLPNKY